MRRHLVWLGWLVVVGCNPPHAAPGDGPAVDSAGDGTIVVPDVADAPFDAAPDAPLDAAPFGDPFAELVAMPPFCSSDNWCWWNPTPHGITYRSVHSTSPTDIWLIGGGQPSAAVVMQWNGYTWTRHIPPVPPGSLLPQYVPSVISSNGPNNVWLIYGNNVEQWDGTTWTIRDFDLSTSSQKFSSVWVDPTGMPWVTTSTGDVRRWHAATNTWDSINVCGGCSGGVWGISGTDLFVTGGSGTFHLEGGQFVQVSPRGTTSFQGQGDFVWAASRNDVTHEWELLHWNGSAFTIVPTDVSGLMYLPAGALANNDVWWYGFGVSGEYYVHWDGVAITSTRIEVTATNTSFMNAARIIDGKWWLVGDSGALNSRVVPNLYEPIISPQYPGGDGWGSSEHDLYFASGSRIRHWDGITWTELSPGVGSIGRLRGISGSGVGGGNELFTSAIQAELVEPWNWAGPNLYRYTLTLGHFDGAAWSADDVIVNATDTDIAFDLATLSVGEALVVGIRGNAFRYHQGMWTPIATGVTTKLIGVWADSGNHAWAVGADGTVLEWNRANPDVMTADTTFPVTSDRLYYVHGADGYTWVAADGMSPGPGMAPAPPHVWMRRPSGGWTSVPTPGLATMQIHAHSANDVLFTTQGRAKIGRWNGTTIVDEAICSDVTMSNAFRVPSGTTYLMGSRGIVVHP